MTSSTRFSSPSLAFQTAATTNAMCFSCFRDGCGSVGLGADGVAEHPDTGGLHLDDVAGRHPAAQLRAAASGGGAGAQDLARVEGERLGGVRDHRLEAVVHVLRVRATPAITVDAHFQID